MAISSEKLYITDFTSVGVGVNVSGGEFGSNIPGKLGTDYTWPDISKIQTLRETGMNIFRVPFLMERLVPGSMTGSPDATYLGDLKKVGLVAACSDEVILIRSRLSNPSLTAVLMLFSILTTMEDSKCGGINRLNRWLIRWGSSGSIISPSDFKVFWKTIASEFASNDKVIFDTSELLSSSIPSRLYRQNVQIGRAHV